MEMLPLIFGFVVLVSIPLTALYIVVIEPIRRKLCEHDWIVPYELHPYRAQCKKCGVVMPRYHHKNNPDGLPAKGYGALSYIQILKCP